MKDLFVNFVGALVFSVIGFFYMKSGIHTNAEEWNQTPQEFCEEFYGTDDMYHEHSDEEMTMEGLS